ncbi:hypothetical protein E1218_09815 [Kribbella turkmenica]|uniref:Uncharacterized protein n=1 Tax=Kribbella turkmenica TaxID=2530375 RepID=A0A4R4XB24_9ACTN|nr:hypothetical protein [Kribbella turkmenica]TDD27672.1 hypothetical protein E1218_09815 [Kribbella turkmenica]
MISAEETIAGLQDALSSRRRVGSSVELCGAAAVVVLTVMLWLTEDDLPTTTQLGFGAIVAVGLLTIARALRALRRRGSLFARDRVIAGWIATAVAVLLASALALAGHGLLGLPLTLAAAGFLLVT